MQNILHPLLSDHGPCIAHYLSAFVVSRIHVSVLYGRKCHVAAKTTAAGPRLGPRMKGALKARQRRNCRTLVSDLTLPDGCWPCNR